MPLTRQKCVEILNIKLTTDELNALAVLASNNKAQLSRILEDVPPPQDAVEDYTTNTNERIAYFQELQGYVKDIAKQKMVITAVAIIMVVPIHLLRMQMQRIRDAIQSCPYSTAINIHINLCVMGPRIIRECLAKGGRKPNDWDSWVPTPQTISSGPSTPHAITEPMIQQSMANLLPGGNQRSHGRSLPAKKKTLERDGYVCFITGTKNPEVAHIFPFASTSERRQAGLFTLLEAFWSPNKASRVKQLLSDPTITESPQNMICLNRQLHFWWSCPDFGLKPLQQTNNEIKVQFHWLKRSCYSKTDFVSSHDFIAPAGLDNIRWGTQLSHRKSGLQVETGQVFTIRANNPNELPNFELLELQFDLVRIAAIAGGAEASDNQFWDSDDDLYDDFGLLDSEEEISDQEEPSS